MKKCKTKIKHTKKKGRSRIVGFSWKTPSGRQSLNESDFFTRKAFMKERQSFKKQGIRIRDYHSRKKYIPYRER